MTKNEMLEASKSCIDNFGEEWFSQIAALLLDKFGWMTPEQWSRVCDRVNQVCTFTPRLVKFYQAAEVLQITRGPGPGARCRACNGNRGYIVYTRERATGYRGSAWSPCSVCSKRPFKDDEYLARWDDTFEMITEKEYRQNVKEVPTVPVPAPSPATPKPMSDYVKALAAQVGF